MGKIFCLMGKSSSGKDTIFKLLINDKELNLLPIITYTTRPKRKNEKNGVNYFFIDEKELQRYEEEGKVIEKRQYQTVNGIWYYCTINDGQINLENANYLVIATLEAYLSLKRFFGADNVVPLYIEVDDATRLERALNRERKQQNPNYNELCRRFLADNEDFSPSKLEAAGIDKVYFNDDLEECVKSIKEDIINVIQKYNANNTCSM